MKKTDIECFPIYRMTLASWKKSAILMVIST